MRSSSGSSGKMSNAPNEISVRAAWRTYKNVFILADDNSMRLVDLGLVHSSAANSLTELILSRLKQEDIVVDGVAPTRLTRYWPPALPEWSTKAVRDAFYLRPKFPRSTEIRSGEGDDFSRA